MTSVTIRRMPSSKYARVEVERRFLLAGVPEGAEILAVHEIDDRYLDGTRLRLRRMALVGGPTQLKLTQKLPDADGHGRQGELTTLYLSEAEHAALAGMPAAALSKSRLSIAPYGVDVFHGALAGLILAEVEFASVEAAAALVPAAFCRAEVTADRRFTGGELVRATGEQVRAWAREYGVEIG
jgi:CYTH domain-containing protein